MLTHSVALLFGLCLLTYHVLSMSLNPCGLFCLRPLSIVGRCYNFLTVIQSVLFYHNAPGLLQMMAEGWRIRRFILTDAFSTGVSCCIQIQSSSLSFWEH